MPVVRIPDPVFQRLQAFATPLIDTPASVIEKLLDFYEQNQSNRRRNSSLTRHHPSAATGPKKLPGFSLRERFRSKLEARCRQAGGHAQTWKGGKAGQHVVEVGWKKRSVLLYFKTRSESDGFWGVTPSRIDALGQSGVSWFVVFIVGPGETSYLAKGEHVLRALDKWSRAQTGEYKVHEPRDVSDFQRFEHFDDLIDELIDAAKRAA